ncbi:MAG: diacylglycerol O-acyltransferase / wax synthase [Frankiaceae bacterium]|nr:diacylglycerol O-acyltransferase / wax synthase [Frankiaceae bacterium]MDX6225418.1 diacylglycerol O-acyltransferase / wax synthase [Frankiales bacterium]
MSLIPALMSPTDAMFLIPESREQPMHVGSLQLYEPPPGSGPDYLTRLYQQAIAERSVKAQFRKRPYRGLSTLGQWAWTVDEDIDLEHHVRHSALPPPGRIRELLALASRLHGTLLDRQRPMWEVHLIEGLADGRFAVYTKIHHSMMDGVAGLRLMARSLSPDPSRLGMPLPFVEDRDPESAGTGAGGSLAGVMRGAANAVSGAVGLAPRLLRIAESGVRDQVTALPLQAPRTALNVPITGSRRFAADGWDLARIKAVGRAADATVNDVVLAMCSGALRSYLLELDALPESSLVAMTPVSLRGADAGDDSGNAVGTILCVLGTDLDEPAQRLEMVKASMSQAKSNLAGLSQMQVTALSGFMVAPLILSTAVADASRIMRPPYNLVVSNVPGPPSTLYWNGSRLAGVYPLSIPTHGQALNITVTSYAGQMEFGLIGCRRTLPHMQRLLTGLDAELKALEVAFGI